jgi:REP element-mobilizing transposase RayT
LGDLAVGGGSRPAATEGKIKPLGQLVGAFKTVSAKRINLLRGTSGLPVWQRDFYERVIRDEDELARIHQYIMDNPSNWQEDDEYAN